MELQVSYRVCAEIQAKSVLRRKADGDRGNTSGVVPVERRRNHRSRSMPRSYSYVGKHPAQDECIRIYGVSERKEQPDDLPKMGQHEIQVQESAILVQRVLRGYCHIFLWTLF